MTKDIDSLRKEIKLMHLKRLKGDITEKAYQRNLPERTVELYRAVVQRRMAKDEKILREHHSIRSHFRLTQSLMKEPEQEAISLFATDRRLYHLRSMVLPDQPSTADSRDRTVIEELRYENLDSVKVYKDIRYGEMAVGAVLCAIAFLFASWLDITGPILIVLGCLGILHGLFLPMKWVEVKAAEAMEGKLAPIRIYASRRKSARGLVRFLREKIRHRSAPLCGSGNEGGEPFQAGSSDGFCAKA